MLKGHKVCKIIGNILLRRKKIIVYDIVCVGFTCLDIPVVGDIGKKVFDIDSTHVDSISMTPGGDAVNESVTCSSLGLNTAIVSYVGSDNGGQVIIEALKAKGVDTSGIEIFEGETSQTAIPLIDRSGERHFLFNCGCSPLFTGLNVDLEQYYQTKVMSIASFYVAKRFDKEGAPVILKGAKEHGVITVADTCSDVMGLGIENVREALPYIDYFMPSLDEAEALSGKTEYRDIAGVFMDMGAKNVVLKLGSKGSYIRSADEEVLTPAFLDTKVIDTTGCGDNFVAGFSYGISKGLSMQECAQFAGAVAGINAGFIGGCGGLKSITEVKEFLAARGISITGL